MNIELISLPRFTDPRGNLSVVEQNVNVPFDIKRVFFTYDVPGGESRADHANKTLIEFIVAVSGSFTVSLDDGKEKRKILLNKPYQGLLVNPMIWRKLEDFSSGAVALVICSDFYNEEDYIRDYDEYLKVRSKTDCN
ncbi:MAG: FdtA/QdtA family cupin domain-containing protein [Muribaculaceae bacterium]|nr:FdtA/QdtA family cupin domain-containing protein [Muribaculaceae bacterium]